MEPCRPISDITNVKSYDSITKIIHRAIILRPDYWYKYRNNLLEISYEETEDFYRLIKDILASINKSIVPSNILLDKLHRKVCRNTLYNEVLSDIIKENPLLVTDELLLTYISTKHENNGVVLISPYDANGETEFSSGVKFSNKVLLDTLRVSLNLEKDTSYETTFKVLKDKSTYICTVCSKLDSYSRCSKCGVAYYCSKEHQTLDWSTHKEICLMVRKCSLYLTYMIAKSNSTPLI